MFFLFYPRKLVQFTFLFFTIITLLLGSVHALYETKFTMYFGQNVPLYASFLLFVLNVAFFVLTVRASKMGWKFYKYFAFILLLFLFSAQFIFGGLYLILYFTFLTSFCFYLAFIVQEELEKPHLSSSQRWYEGKPSEIPNLHASIVTHEKKYDCLMNRIDEDGAALFFSEKIENLMEFIREFKVSSKKSVLLHLEFSKIKIELEFFPVIFYKKNKVLGILFKNKSMDHKKELGDLLELLKGAGYVSL